VFLVLERDEVLIEGRDDRNCEIRDQCVLEEKADRKVFSTDYE
jgi:hypothetical protein